MFEWIEKQMRMDAGAQDPTFKIIAGPLEKIFVILTKLRAWFFRIGLLRIRSLPGDCISIGNLVVGGTGKSPLVISLCQFLISEGKRPAVLMRGYRSGLARGEVAVFLNGKCVEASRGSQICADEARMISAHCEQVPVVIGANRIRAFEYFQSKFGDRFHPTHWILDDGFQHRQIARKWDYVVISSHQSFGNGRLLPRGILREPVAALRRATKILLTNPEPVSLSNLRAELEANGVGHLDVAEVRLHGYQLKQVTHPSSDAGHVKYRFAAVAGIANPARFLNDLSALGIEVVHSLVVPDHQRFDQDALNTIAAKSDAIITTSKDYWRDPSAFEQLAIPCFVLELRVDGQLWQELANS